MFCTNCGNQLPEGSKFCPNCGARIITGTEAAENAAEEARAALDSAGIPYPDVPAEAAEEAAAAVETAEEAVTETAEYIAGEAAETADEVREAAEEAVTEAAEEVAEAAETAEEFTESAEKAAEEVFEEAAGTAEEAAEGAQEAVEEVTETVGEAVESAEEAVEDAAESVDDAVEGAEEAAADAADNICEIVDNTEETVEETADAVTGAAAEAAEDLGGIYKMVSQDAAETAGEIYAGAEEAVTYSAEEISETAEAVEEMAEAAAETAEDALPYVSDPVIENPDVSPYAAGAVSGTAAAPVKKKKKGLTALIALLLIAALGVGGYFVYQNLPSQKVKRFKAAGAEAKEAGNFAEAAVQYKSALEIDPEDLESFDALIMMHESLKNDAFEDSGLGLYEQAIDEIKLANSILPEIEEEDLDNVMMVYFSWAGDLAYKGDTNGANEVLNMAKADELGDARIAKIQEYIDRSKRLHDIEADMEAVSEHFTGLQENVIQTVFDTLIEKAPVLQEYMNDYGKDKYVYSFDGGNSAVVWTASSVRDAVEIYIGPVRNISEPYGVGEMYFVSNYSKDERSYEYFMANWSGGAPNGPFSEINLAADPESEEHYKITGQVKGNCVDGKYDGDISNERSGNVYYMKFDLGKVQVLDTIDPNGEECNVVGYTEDHNSWITFGESGLDGSYGLRYIAFE